MFRAAIAAGLLLSAGSVALAQSDAAASSTASSLKIVDAVGTLTTTVAANCQNITRPIGDACDFVTLTGISKIFKRFGGFKENSQFVICESTDTFRAVPKRNDGTTCAPSSELGILTSGNKSTTFSMAGQTWTLPGSATGFSVFNQFGAITNSTTPKITTGGRSFNAWENGSSGTFNLSANYSK